MYSIMIIGTAGSGKTALTAAFSEWLKGNERNVGILNLDPGVKWLPYAPDIDIREYIDFEAIMEKYNLGPNGALVACIDMIANYFRDIRDEINLLEPEFLLVDTPGQMELFAFRSVGPYIISRIGGENIIVLCLLDSIFTKNPSSFVSALLLSTSVQYRFLKPQINVISKSDLLTPEEKERIEHWIENPEKLKATLIEKEQTLRRELSKKLIDAISSELLADLVFTSAMTWEGLDNLFAIIQRICAEV